MEEILVILLLVIFFVLLSVKKNVNQKFSALQAKIDALTAELKRSRQLARQPEEGKLMSKDEIVEQAFKKPAPIPEKKAFEPEAIEEEEEVEEEQVEMDEPVAD